MDVGAGLGADEQVDALQVGTAAQEFLDEHFAQEAGAARDEHALAAVKSHHVRRRRLRHFLLLFHLLLVVVVAVVVVVVVVVVVTVVGLVRFDSMGFLFRFSVPKKITEGRRPWRRSLRVCVCVCFFFLADWRGAVVASLFHTVRACVCSQTGRSLHIDSRCGAVVGST